MVSGSSADSTRAWAGCGSSWAGAGLDTLRRVRLPGGGIAHCMSAHASGFRFIEL